MERTRQYVVKFTSCTLYIDIQVNVCQAKLYWVVLLRNCHKITMVRLWVISQPIADHLPQLVEGKTSKAWPTNTTLDRWVRTGCNFEFSFFLQQCCLLSSLIWHPRISMVWWQALWTILLHSSFSSCLLPQAATLEVPQEQPSKRSSVPPATNNRTHRYNIIYIHILYTQLIAYLVYIYLCMSLNKAYLACQEVRSVNVGRNKMIYLYVNIRWLKNTTTWLLFWESIFCNKDVSEFS